MAASLLSSVDGFPSSNSPDNPLTPSGDGTSKRTTALTTRLSSVLSSSYTDHEIRDTLRILDARGISNDEETRRGLKANAQREVIDCNARIVDDFGAVAAQLKRVGEMIGTLNSTCAVMRGHILAAKRESAPVLEDAGTLMKRQDETRTKEALLSAFTTHFLVRDEELNVLTSSAEPLDDRFFTALARVKLIHRDCSILLGYNTTTTTSSSPAEGEDDTEQSSSRLGLELLESTTRTLDASFKKLYTWIQSRFKTLDIEDPHISGSIRRALRVLSERPSLFQNCLDFFAEARQRTLSEAFQAALTGGGGGGPGAMGMGMPGKAIEFSTHEPLRYVGDMLAWVHSAAVSEKEALEGLFVGDEEEIVRGLQEGRSSEPWARINKPGRRRRSLGSVSSPDDEAEAGGVEEEEEIFDGRKALSELIARNLSLVYQTLQSRVDMTVRTSGDPVLTFKVFNLLDFYRGIFAKLLGEESTLSRLIQNQQSSTLALFEKSMGDETSAAVAAIDPDAAHDLTPPVFLATALAQFSEVCRARGPQMRAAELERLFAAMLSVILTACAETATQIPDKRKSSIYKINYMTALRASLANVSIQVAAAHVPLEKAAQEIQVLRDQLVEFVATTFHEYSGVADLTQEIDARRRSHSYEQKKWLVENLDEAAQRLDEFLSSALMDAQEALKPLLDRTLAKDVVAEAVERFCVEFDELEGLLDSVDVETTEPEEDGGDADDAEKDKINGPLASLRELYPRTGAEVRALLS